MFRSTPSAGARTALAYITVGSLLVVWTAVWYVYLMENKPLSNGPYYWAGGLLLTGIVFICIGFGTGRIGYAAKKADNPAIVTTLNAPETKVEPAETAVKVQKEVAAPPTSTNTVPKKDHDIVVTRPV